MLPKKRKASRESAKPAKPTATSATSAAAEPPTVAESSKATQQAGAREGLDAWWALAQQNTNIISHYKIDKKTEHVAKDPLFDYIATEAGKALSLLRQHLGSFRRSDDIDWSSFLNGIRLTNRAEAVYLFLRLRNDFGDFEGGFSDMDVATRYRLADMVQEKFPYQEKNGGDHQKAAFLAFSKSEAPGLDRASSSLDLLEQIDKLVNLYDVCLNTADRFLSPYTSVIGPSGMGKSFAVKHLAETRNRYVIYASLGEKCTVPPPAKPLSKVIRSLPSLNAATCFFSNFSNLAFGLLEAAKAVGVRPGLLFRLQSDRAYVSFQDELTKLLAESMEEEKLDSIDEGAAAATLIPLLRDTIKQHGLEHDLNLDSSSGANIGLVDASAATAECAETAPPLIVCFDEARFLLTRRSDDPCDDTPLLFRGFRRALAASRKKVFGLLLDTSSKVSNFLPPVVDDPSLKIAYDKGDLLPPIFSLQTWDVAARASPQVGSWLKGALPHRKGEGGGEGGAPDGHGHAWIMHGPDGSIEFQQFLYSLGRPLWASIMQAHLELERNFDKRPNAAESRAVEETIKLAQEKTFGDNDHERRLALLSYRLQFNVHDQRLTNSLMSRWLRYPVRVSEDRSHILSIQPGEPILAAVAAMRMRSSKKLADDNVQPVQSIDQMVDTLFKYYNDGAINVGDVGEMVASFLLLWAADVAAQNANVLRRAPPQAMLATAFPMMDFLGVLFGSRPPLGWAVNARGENDGEDACVFVTRIMRLCTDSEVGHLTAEQLEMGFLTGEGWLLEKYHSGADLLLPVWHKTSKRMSALLIQVKNIKPRSPSSATFAPAVVAEAWKALERARVTLEGVLSDVHVYGLYLDLGEDAETRLTLPVQWLPRNDAAYPHLSLAVARGCSADVFPVLAGHDGSSSRLRAMLARGREPYADDTKAIANLILTRDGRTL